MKWNFKTITTLSMLAVAGASLAVEPTIDGTYDASYGTALAIQDTQTQFGDSPVSYYPYCGGSELDAIYAQRGATGLYIFISGNLESNYNKLTLFVDCKTGGQNQLGFVQSDQSFGGLKRISDSALCKGDGLKFGAGFNPDYWMVASGGYDGTGYGFYLDRAKIGDPLSGVFVGKGTIYDNGAGGYNPIVDLSADPGGAPAGAKLIFDHSNILGVDGGSGLTALATTNAGAGSKGAEMFIPYDQLGIAAADAQQSVIKLYTFVNGSGNDYLSNQHLPGVGGVGNLAEPRGVNLGSLPGTRYVVVPGAAAYANVSGKIALDGAVLKQLDIQFVEAGTQNLVTEAVAAQLTDNGDGTMNYTVIAPKKANLDMIIKGGKYLSARVPANTTGGDVTVAGSTPMNTGDIDGDDTVSILDYSVLSDYFDADRAVTLDEGWCTVNFGGATNGFAPMDADLDGDNVISILDYSVLSDNFDKFGQF